ncbi:MAG TPA: hypothetical protein PKG79_00515 [Propioniciclava tarda]|nr:hypothetical protein [Propioniciclava tarda]
MTNDFSVLPVVPPDEGEVPDGVRTAVAGAATISRGVWLDLFGHVDFARSPEAWLHRMTHRVSYDRPLLVAVAGARADLVGLKVDDVLGYAYYDVPLADNLHTLDALELGVRPSARRRGVGSALVAAVKADAAARGRTHVMGWMDAPIAGTDETGALRSRTDPITARPTAGSAFALAHGFAVAQIERYSVLTVPAVLADAEVAPGYRLEAWIGPTPPHHRAGLASLWTAFGNDQPLGDVALGEEAWDADRIAATEAASAAVCERCTAVAIHEASGEVVGASQLFRDLDKDEAATQGVTQVLRTHRGHRLGLALKRHNLRVAKAGWPALARIHTWNAGENDHMWRINEALGYQTRAAEICWQWIAPSETTD